MSDSSADNSSGWALLSGGVAFVAVTVAGALAVFAEELLRSTAGVVLLLPLTIVLFVALIAVDVPSAIDDIEGNTFSELLRAGGTQTTIFPWTLAIFAGRWFHPADGFDPLGVVGAVILMVLTFVVVAGDGVLRHYADVAVPSWIVVAAGVVAGAVLWPVG